MSVETFIKAWTTVVIAILGIVLLSAVPGCAYVKCFQNTYQCGFN